MPIINRGQQPFGGYYGTYGGFMPEDFDVPSRYQPGGGSAYQRETTTRPKQLAGETGGRYPAESSIYDERMVAGNPPPPAFRSLINQGLSDQQIRDAIDMANSGQSPGAGWESRGTDWYNPDLKWNIGGPSAAQPAAAAPSSVTPALAGYTGPYGAGYPSYTDPNASGQGFDMNQFMEMFKTMMNDFYTQQRDFGNQSNAIDPFTMAALNQFSGGWTGGNF